MKFPITWLLVPLLGGTAYSANSGPEKAAELLATATSAGAAASPIDEKNGFRTFHFGDDISRFPHLAPALFREKDGIQTCSMKRGKENLKIGDAVLQNISYTFFHGKLYYVDLITDGPENFQKVTAAATSLYGQPAPTLSGNAVKWEGQKAEARTLSVARGGLVGGTTGYLRIKSKTIDDEVKAAQGNANKKSSADL